MPSCWRRTDRRSRAPRDARRAHRPRDGLTSALCLPGDSRRAAALETPARILVQVLQISEPVSAQVVIKMLVCSDRTRNVIVLETESCAHSWYPERIAFTSRSDATAIVRQVLAVVVQAVNVRRARNEHARDLVTTPDEVFIPEREREPGSSWKMPCDVPNMQPARRRVLDVDLAPADALSHDVAGERRRQDEIDEREDRASVRWVANLGIFQPHGGVRAGRGGRDSPART